MIRYHRSLYHKLCRLRVVCRFYDRLNCRRNQSFQVPGGVWSQGWNLKKLPEGHHQEWNLRLNLTQHGKTYQVQTKWGLTDWELFLDSLGGGAWPFLVGGVICLVYSVNERDPRLLNNRIYQFDRWRFLRGTCSIKLQEDEGDNRSVMPLDVLNRTRVTMVCPKSFILAREVWEIF